MVQATQPSTIMQSLQVSLIIHCGTYGTDSKRGDVMQKQVKMHAQEVNLRIWWTLLDSQFQGMYR